MDACNALIKKKFRYKWLDVEKAPFLFLTEPHSPIAKWSGFEDIWSIDFKVKYLMNAGLGGATLFSLDKDDYHDMCGQEMFPLLRVINYHLNRKHRVDFPGLGALLKTEAALFNQMDEIPFINHILDELYPFKNISNYSTGFLRVLLFVRYH